MGPGVTTYAIPAELFPTAARATCHGLSAATGKLGAAIGSYAFGSLIDQIGLRGEARRRGAVEPHASPSNGASH